MRVSDGHPKYLTQEQVSAFFRAIPRDKVRDRLLFGFIYRYALRTQEACRLPIEAVDMARMEVTVEGMKHGLRRTYPIFRELRSLVRKYRPVGATYFAGRQGGLDRSRVWQLFRHYAGKAGLAPGLGVHSLRHSAAVHLLDAGGTIEEARDLLRHRHIATTEVYADLSTTRRGNYLRRLDNAPEIVRIA